MKTKIKEFNDATPWAEITGILFKIFLSVVKSFIFALYQIVWVFTGMLLIGACILFLVKNGDIKTLTELPKGLIYLLDIFRNYWSYFFIGIWIFDFIINFRDINKDEN